MASLTESARAKVMLKETDYTINNIRSGACLLKVVIGQLYLDSNATTKFIRESLSNLDDYMSTIDSDIEKFNEHVEDLMDSLAARGEESQDLLTNLFKAYSACEDANFRHYMELKESAFDEGQVFTAEQLMQLAMDKYSILKHKGKWMAQTEDQKKIVALEAQVSKLQKTKAPANKPNKATTKPKPKGNSKSNQTRKKTERPAWMMKSPKQGESHEKVVEGKTYYWCHNHKAWVRHRPEDCKGQGVHVDTSPATTSQSNTNNAGQGIRLVRALAAVVEGESDQDS